MHLRHLALYLLVWQPTHHAYPSFSTKGVVESKGYLVSALCPRSKDGVGKTYITTLCAEEVANMPFCSTCDNYLALNGRFATLAARTERFVEVESAEEPQRLVTVLFLQSSHVFLGYTYRYLNVKALLTLLDTSQALGSLLVWLGVKCDAFEVDATIMTLKT